MTLFEECLLVLDDSTKLSNNETLEIYNLMAELLLAFGIPNKAVLQPQNWQFWREK